VGCGVNGRAVAGTFLARGRDVLLYDSRPGQAEAVAEGLGEGAAATADLAWALACDIVATVTPGRHVVFGPGSLRPGQHASLMGADGPGKAEIAVEELLRARVVCDEWAQASHNGDIARAVEAGQLGRDGVSELGRVLLGEEPGRTSDDDVTIFDSTGLAVQDLAVALAVWERWSADPGAGAFADVPRVDLA
jgi:alanine dehydrogenase